MMFCLNEYLLSKWRKREEKTFQSYNNLHQPNCRAFFFNYRLQNAHNFKAKEESVNDLLFISGMINTTSTTTNDKAGLST